MFVNVPGDGRYFEDDDDDQKTLAELEYQPAPGSPTLDRMNALSASQKEDDSSSDSSDDPLDSFMADIEARCCVFSFQLILICTGSSVFGQTMCSDYLVFRTDLICVYFTFFCANLNTEVRAVAIILVVIFLRNIYYSLYQMHEMHTVVTDEPVAQSVCHFVCVRHVGGLGMGKKANRLPSCSGAQGTLY